MDNGDKWGYKGVAKKRAALTRNLCLTLPQLDFNLIQAEAARNGVPLTVMLRQWIEPELEALRRRKRRDDAN